MKHLASKSREVQLRKLFAVDGIYPLYALDQSAVQKAVVLPLTLNVCFSFRPSHPRRSLRLPSSLEGHRYSSCDGASSRNSAELFIQVVESLVVSVGLFKAVRLRLICSQFRTMMLGYARI